MPNPQMFVEVVTTGGQANVTVVGHGDNVGDAFGDDEDFVIVLKSALNNANTGITDVLEGTPVTPALAANSTILSNTTANGDILIAVNTGTVSEAVFWADASADDTAVMAPSGGSVDIYIAGTKEYDFSASTLDMNDNTLTNIGGSGNDWTATVLSHTGTILADKSGVAGHRFRSTDNRLELNLDADSGNGAAAVDTTIYFRHDGTSQWSVGNDGSETNRFAISIGGSSGTDDALRIVRSTRAITFDDSSGADFDYVCDDCGWHSVEETDRCPECRGRVQWHDDMPALMERNTETGLAHLVKLGVYELDGPEDSDPGWLGINFQQAQHFTWSAMGQMYRELDRRLEAIGG